MRSFTLVSSLFVAALAAAPMGTMQAQDADRAVKDGGIKVDGWKGRVDRRAATQGKTVADSKFAKEGDALRISVGPAGNFWNPAHVAKGDYQVKATFKEHKMAASHPHSYGIFIGGADLESEAETLLYCIGYGDGTYAVKTFNGPKVTTLVNREASPALKKADANGESTNEIGWRVQGGKASCVINGTAVKTFETAEVVGADKLKALDGNYGIRVSHNLELSVTGLALSKP
jgi:opacity protein-like surface antigen